MVLSGNLKISISLYASLSIVKTFVLPQNGKIKGPAHSSNVLVPVVCGLINLYMVILTTPSFSFSSYCRWLFQVNLPHAKGSFA